MAKTEQTVSFSIVRAYSLLLYSKNKIFTIACSLATAEYR